MKKNKTIIFASHPDFSGNTKALYEYMREHSENMNLYWVIYDNTNYDAMVNKGIKTVIHGTEEFEKIFNKTDVVIFDHDELLDKKKEHQKYIYLSHGFACKKFGYFLDDGNLAAGDKKYLELMNKNIDYMISSSEFCKLIFQIAYDFDYKRILPLGYPRADYIYSDKSRKNLELISNKKLGDFSKVIMYLPTFRNGLGRESDGEFTDNIFNIDRYDEKKLDEYLVKNNYLLVIKYHPYETNKNNKYQSNNIVYLDDNIMTKNFITLTEIISAADLIVADYSSAHSEALILDIPVCFLKNDIELYRKNRGILIDDTDVWFPGPFVKNLTELKKEFLKLLNDSQYYQKERKQYVALEFGKNLKDNSKRVYEYLFDKKFNLFEQKSNIVDDEKIELYNENMKLKLDIMSLKNELDSIKKSNCELKKQNQDISNKLLDSYNQLDVIYNSKGWKILEKIRRIKK